jgi:hypothetical protein
MSRITLMCVLCVAMAAPACDSPTELELEPASDTEPMTAAFPFPSCRTVAADRVVQGGNYGQAVLIESPDNNYGSYWCDRWVVDVQGPQISNQYYYHNYQVVGTSSYSPPTAATCNAHRIDVQTWGEKTDGSVVSIFSYVAQGSWTGSSCAYQWSPGVPPVVGPQAFVRVRSAVKVTGLLGNRMRATAGVVRY